MTRYYVTVKSGDENFIAYAVDTIEEAAQFADFCHASMLGARVSIDQIDWDIKEDEYATDKYGYQ